MDTVFVVGAGASKEVGLPLGSELKKEIAGLLDIRYEHGHQRISGSSEIDEAFRIAAAAEVPSSRDINPYLHASWRVRDAMPQAISIDNYIDCHSGDKRLELSGKLAIALSILRAEAKSTLFVYRQREAKPKLDFERLGGSWFTPFWQLLTENCQVSDLPRRLSSVTLIVFNYDRCIEQFLFHACKNYYSLDDNQTAEALATLTVLHPYGSVGTLPSAARSDAIEFVQTPSNATRLLAIAKGLRTFTEGTDSDSSEIKLIRERVANARRLVFLGFAFHRLNMSLLLPSEANGAPSVDRFVYGTASGISESDVDDISTEVSTLAAVRRENVKLRIDLECRTLFREYWRGLCFS